MPWERALAIDEEALGPDHADLSYTLIGLGQALLDQGYAVRVYLPYGPHWYPYFLRRVAERPGNLWFALRSVFSR